MTCAVACTPFTSTRMTMTRHIFKSVHTRAFRHTRALVGVRTHTRTYTDTHAHVRYPPSSLNRLWKTKGTVQGPQRSTAGMPTAGPLRMRCCITPTRWDSKRDHAELYNANQVE
eukprot:scaffold239108_cov23-Tisochrysis_lutea.AAC.2